MILRVLISAIFFSIFAAGWAYAQAPAAEGPAKLLRVDEGIFEISEGKVMDLTDRKITLAFRKQRREEVEKYGNIRVMIGGTWGLTLQIGDRVDIKKANSFKDLLEDKSRCYIDLTDIAIPKGAPIVATFRMDCE